MRRLLAIGDLHCGHLMGLTHPDFDATPKRNDTHRFKLYRERRRMWKFFAETVSRLKPEILIVNGDAIDGKGKKSGGTELLTTDRTEQVDMAGAAIESVGASQVYMTFGTPYHTGQYEDWEREIAKAVKAAKIGGDDSLSVNGLVFNYRHYIGRSSIPHGKYTPIARDRLWNVLWNDRGEYPKAHVILRSHVHYFAYCGDADWLAMTLPALQGYGTKYGARQMSGMVDFGLVWFDIMDRKDFTWHYKVMRYKSKQRELLVA